MSSGMLARLSALLAALLISGSACTSEDPRLERRGGSDLPTPVRDPVSSDAGAGAAAGNAVAGGGAGGADIASPGVSFCDALAVIAAKCQRCHQDPPRNGAPAPLLTYEDTRAELSSSGSKLFELMLRDVERDIMPLVALNDPPTSLMPPVEPLTPDEKVTLLTWLRQGALPAGGTACP